MEKLKMCFRTLPFFICMVFFCFNYELFSGIEILIYTIIVSLFFTAVYNIMFSLLVSLDKNKDYKTW